MWSIFAVLVVAIVIGLVELPSLRKSNCMKEKWTFSVLLLLGVCLHSAILQDIDVPNPLDWITTVYKPLSDVIFQR